MFNSSKHHKGMFIPKNKGKYIGDITNIQYRSHWELLTMRYLDFNPDVQYWSSETTHIPYRCPSDNEVHKYHIDFTIKYHNGKILLVEVKPEKQTVLPKSSKGKSKKTNLTEHLTFMKNRAKWIAADKYAKANNATFRIWTEITLRRLGIPIL